MISFLEGIVKLKTNNFIIINVNGIGFKLFMSENSLNQIENNQRIKVYTYMRVLQDDISLFGFLNYEELSMFELLIGVSGIGAKSAINILSKIEPSKFALAVITNDINTFKRTSGYWCKVSAKNYLRIKR